MAKRSTLSQKLEILQALAVLSIRCEEDTKVKILDGDPDAILVLWKAVDYWVKDILDKIIRKCCTTVSQGNQWSTFASAPTQFNSQLDRYLNGAKTAMRLLYNVPDHRPVTEEEKDERIAALKEQYPDASFEKLSRKFKQQYGESLSAGATERAYKRHLERTQQRVKHALKLAEQFRQQSTLPEDELLAKLPSPEHVLEILIKK